MKLMKRLVLIFVLALGFAWNCHAQSWTFVQESLIAYCVPGQSSCSASGGTLAPTTAGTVRVVFIRTATGGSAPNVTITSVSGLGSTWNLCPASSCHILGNDDLDMAYAIGGSGGQTNFTVNLSGASGTSFFSLIFYEFLPPAGFTASFDASAMANHACSSGTTTGISLPVTATDLILLGRGNGDPSSWNAYSSPYIQTAWNNGLSLNDSTGAAPTVGCTGSSMIFNAIAFKSTAGTFTPPTPKMKAVNYVNNNGLSCGPSCSLTIPSTGSGNLLYVQSAHLFGAQIQSISSSPSVGTWVVPSGTGSCRNTMTIGSFNYALSCAYVLSTSPGVTSLSITMTGSGTAAFAVMEVQPAIGSSFSFDVQGSTQNAASFNPSGQPLTLSGNADVIFQTIFVPGGTTGVSYYPMPPSAPKQGFMFMNNEAAFAALLNTSSGVTPTWANQQSGETTLVSGVAFKTASGTATAPNPPTSLTAVVH